MPTQGNPKFTVRLPEEKRLRFVAESYNAGTTAAALVVEFVDAMLGEPGAQMPQPFKVDREGGDTGS
jgi:hypothetical protein